jgi:hypothetical protein
VIYEELWPTAKLKDEYSKYADRFKADFGPGQSMDDGKPGLFRNMIRKMFNFDKGGIPVGVDRTYVREFWIKDRTRGSDGMPLFPGGRHLIKANEIIIVDEPNPYWDNKCPIDLLTWHFDPDSVWSFGDVELYKSPQQILNKIIAAIVENALLINNAMWVGDFNALDPKGWDNLTNAPGAIIKKRPGAQLDRVSPPELGTTSFNVVNMLMGGLENLSSMSEAMRGQAPGSVQSGTAVESLQVAAQTTIRLMSRKLEETLNSIGCKQISRIFQFMTEDRIFHITGDGGLMKSYHFERARLAGDPRNAFNDYKFMVVPGSSLSLTKWQKGTLAFQLFTAGLVPGTEVLDAYEYPNRDRLTAQVAAEQQAMMAQELAVAQAAGEAKMNKGKNGGNRKPGYIPKPDSPPNNLVAGAPDQMAKFNK